MTTARPYHDDQELILALVKQRPPARITDFPSVIDLQEMLGVAAIQEHTCLWEDEHGTLLGYALLDDGSLAYEGAPELEGEMLAWAEADARRAGWPSLDLSCREDDLSRLAALEALGFTRLDEGGVFMSRSLLDPLPAPVLPPGFTIRPIAGEEEVEAHVTLHRAAWGTENMTVEYRLSMMRTPTYDRELDLVAVAPDGRLAAYCMCYISPEENELSGCHDGYTDPIATHPDYQRQGLAKALMLAGMELLRARGMDTARLGTGRDNVAMQRTAAAVGFRVVSSTVVLSKALAS